MLFASEDTSTGVIGALIGVVVSAVVAGVVKIMSTKHVNSREIRADTRAEFEQMFNRMQREIEDLQEKDERREAAHRDCESRCQRLSVRVTYMEYAMKQANIPFPPEWTDKPPSPPGV